MKKKKNKQRILILTITTFFTVVCWVGFSVYRTNKKTTIPKVLEEQLEPLHPEINQELLQSLQSRNAISEEKLKSPPEIFYIDQEAEKTASPEAEKVKEATPEAGKKNEKELLE